MQTNKKDAEHLSFDQVMDLFHNKIDELFGDPLLSDLPQHITLDEVKSMTSLEYGQAMTIKVRRADGEMYSVIVDQKATVSDLKKAIKHHVELQQSKQDSAISISWKYVWKNYWLQFEGEKLKDNNKILKHYGIQNRDEVNFIKRLNE